MIALQIVSLNLNTVNVHSTPSPTLANLVYHNYNRIFLGTVFYIDTMHRRP